MIYILFFITVTLNILLTISVSYRMSGIITKLISVSNSIEKILNLFSRSLTTILFVLLVAFIEKKLVIGTKYDFLFYFRVLIFANTVGVIIGMFLIPIAIKVISKISVRYSIIRDEFKIYVWVLKSIPKVFRKEELNFPSFNNLIEFFVLKGDIPVKILLINTISQSFSYLSIYSCLYVAIRHPEIRMTALSMSAVFQGITAILSNLFVEIKLGLIADETSKNHISHITFNKIIIFYLLTRLIATILAQFMLISCADILYILIKEYHLLG